jgi:hypothetical protein
MLGRRRKEAGDRTLPRLEDTVARLVCFTVLTRTRRGRTKTAAIRVLTTLLDRTLSRQRRSRLFMPRDGRWKPLFCI